MPQPVNELDTRSHSDSLCQADARLLDFCQDTGGDLVSSRCNSWRRGQQSTSLNNTVTWNYHPFSTPGLHFEAKHKFYDHGVLGFALPIEDFITTFKALKGSFDILTDRVDVVLFQRNLLQWHKNVQQRISPFANDGEEETGDSLLKNLREEQDIMRGEAFKLQGRAEISRRRAHERRPNRRKEQVRIRRLHATLAVASSEVLRATADSRVIVVFWCFLVLPQMCLARRLRLRTRTAVQAYDDELGQCEQDLCVFPAGHSEHNIRELVAFYQGCWHFKDFQHNKGTIAALELMTKLKIDAHRTASGTQGRLYGALTSRAKNGENAFLLRVASVAKRKCDL